MVSLARHLALVAALLFLPAAQAFVPPTPRTKTTTTALGLFEMFNEGKKLLVKKLAGNFDEAAICSRMDSLVAENPVLMLR